MSPVPDAPAHRYGQCEDCSFWEVMGEYGVEYWPIDPRAVYGHPRLGDRDPGAVGVTVRADHAELVQAIRSVRPGDRVRVNDGGWMDVVEPDGGFVDEGFCARYESGSVLYAIRTSNPSDNPPGTFNSPWMRRWDDHSSAGGVGCLEVDWNIAGTDREMRI